MAHEGNKKLAPTFKSDLSKVLNSEAKEAVLRWSETASEEELQTVTKFFHEVGQDEAGKRMESLPNLEKLRNSDVIKIIRDRSKRLRLLSPDSRKNKFEKQTWHHMPPVKNNSPYEFTQSHYRNVKPVARGHYVYHPDLYP